MKALLSLLLLAGATTAMADTLTIERVRHAGPYIVKSPVVLDSIDNTQAKFNANKTLDTRLPLSTADNAAETSLSALKTEKGTLHLISFDINATRYVKGVKLNVKGAKRYKLYEDGRETPSLTLTPGHHRLNVKFLADTTSVSMSLIGKDITLNDGQKRAFTMADNLGTKIISRSTLSPSGRYVVIGYSWYDSMNKVQRETILRDLKTGQERKIYQFSQWMPQTDRYIYITERDGMRSLMSCDPTTARETVLMADMPSTDFAMSPTEDFLIIMTRHEGPKKEQGVFEIVHPDDRQPGWRTRNSLSRLDLKSGLLQPLTYTYRPTSLTDISPDGRRLLFSVSTDTLTQRPTTRRTFYEMDLETLQLKTLVENDGFINHGMYAGNTGKLVFYGSTEAFNNIGNRVPAGKTPNMYDHHLYLLDSATRQVTPLTADDKTSIEGIDYSPADGHVYYRAQNGDSVSLYRLDLKTLRSHRVAQPLEVLGGFSIASRGGNIMVYGSSACTPYQAYNITAPATKPRCTLVCDPNADRFSHIQLGTVHDWRFTTSRGYDVSCHYYLPAGFDQNKKYPMIVHYYGGCSPTSRRFGGGSHYPAHYWNALGYIVLTVNPSGASGFGQEWASRHVNTMGEGPAQDIIDATREFARQMPQVNADKIGCVSASYGGFMTQYMLTKPNHPFACGISHAGISDHTSYWGEGYWGYSYSEVSAANSFPWTRKDLYVDRSPLYNADKITKPLLFTHGTADTNVPIGESIQMYTALKLLGRPTAFVQVEGENHGIMDPVKRTKWINTMVAWFQRWLQDDDTWWNAIYTPKNL